eukprot:TRINITY_DN21559_c0_g1_i1.p1 TRINITY_DN21559_c0_g1~~TRINITY_DN21559_c0_g1_i1.p1  ORF type:complete len:3213 (+),score=696.80 TRINITY_DN21559_c0_g1_i1:53-9691(+)
MMGANRETERRGPEVTNEHGTEKWCFSQPNVTIYLRAGTKKEHEEVAANIVNILQKTDGFGEFAIGRNDSEKPTYSHQALNPRRMVPYQKRLGHVFLSLLGREEEIKECLPLVPQVELKRSLLDRTDKDTIVTINHKVIDKICRESMDKGINVDETWVEYVKEYSDPSVQDELRITSSKYGPAAKEIYGSGEFSITVKELQQLERGIRLATSLALPRKFYAKLVQFATGSVNTQRFFDLRRSIPLEHLANIELQDGQRQELLKTWSYREANAIQNHDELLRLKAALMKSTTKLSKDEVTKICTYNYDLDNFRIVARNARIKIEQMQDPVVIQRDNEIVMTLHDFVNEVRSAPSSFGFTDGAEHSALRKSLTELCTDVCVSQKGYFFVDGKPGAPNQLTKKTPQPVVFLSSPGLDFCDPSTTILEAKKYFKKLDTKDGQPKWRGFLSGAHDDLLQRVTRLYRVIFRSCQGHGVCNPSMLAMGLGVFLQNIHEDDRDKVAEAYFTAQFQLLCEQDWGFHNYFVNPVRYKDVGMRALEAELKKGKQLCCNVVMHGKDVKFLATEMAKGDPSRPGSFQSPAMLNPSDCASIFLGLMGYFWEWGRQECYVGEEDFCCTGTGTLALSTITNVYGDSSRHLQDETSTAKPTLPRTKVRTEPNPKSLAQLVQLCRKLSAHDSRPEERPRLRKSIITGLETGSIELTDQLEGIRIVTTLSGGPEDDAKLLEAIITKLQINVKAVESVCGTLGTTPLHLAAYFGHMDTIVCLVQEGHPLTLGDERCETVYDKAINTTVKPLIRAAACSKLLRAIDGKTLHPKMLNEELLGNRDKIKSNSTKQATGWSFMHWGAALCNEKLLAKARKSPQSDRNHVDDDGWTPLYWIIARQSSALLQTFLAHESPTEPEVSLKLCFNDTTLIGRFTLCGRWVDTGTDGTELLIEQRGELCERIGREYLGTLRDKQGRTVELDIEMSARLTPQQHVKRSITATVTKSSTDRGVWQVLWNETKMLLTIDAGDRTYSFAKEKPDSKRLLYEDYTTVVHVCCNLGLDAMAAKLIAHDATLLDVRCKETHEKPFITALLNHGREHHGYTKPDAENIDLISELLTPPDDQDLKDTRKEIRNRCVQALRESLRHPLVTTEKGWFLQVMGRSESTVTSIIKQLCQYEDTRQVARSVLLYALQNACACLGPKDDVGDPRKGDPSLVTRVVSFLMSLRDTVPDLSWELNTMEALITADCPTEADITVAEGTLDTVFWTSRYLVGKTFSRLINAISSITQLYHDGFNKKQFTIEELSEVLDTNEIPTYPSHEGARVIDHTISLYQTYKDQNRGSDADQLAYALLLLLQLHCNGKQSALAVAVMHERTSIIDMLLKQTEGKLVGTYKNLLREAIGTRRWAAVDILLPYAKRYQPDGVYLFDYLPSARLEKGRDPSYPEAPSQRELELCSDHDLVHPRNYAAVLACHGQWLRSRQTTPKTIEISWADTSKKFTIQKSSALEENSKMVYSWLLGLPDSKGTGPNIVLNDKYGDAVQNLQLLYDDVSDGATYTAFCVSFDIPSKQIDVVGPKETKTVSIFKNENARSITELVRRRFMLPCSIDNITFQDKNGEDISLSFANVIDGEKYTMTSGPERPTWTEVLKGSLQAGKEKVAVVQYLLGTSSVNLNDFFTDSENRKCFPFFDFGFENPRAAEVFLVICRLLHMDTGNERLLNDGFVINGIAFTPDDTEPLRYPLHALLLKAHDATGGTTPTQLKDGKVRKRVTDLIIEVVTFINQVLAGKEGPGMSNIVRDYVLSLPCSTYSSSTSIIIPSGGGGLASDLADYKDLYPIELAIKLHNAEVLKAIFGKISTAQRYTGLEEVVLKYTPSDPSDNNDTLLISCFKDSWFPDNDEWHSRDGVGVIKACTKTKRPLLHQALDLLTFPKPCRYMAEQAYLLETFLTRYPHVAKQARSYVNVEKKTLQEEVGVPWFPPGHQHLEKWSSDVGLSNEEMHRREIVDVLLDSAEQRQTFRFRAKRSTCDRVELAIDDAVSVVFSKEFDRCGLFKTVSLNSASSGVMVRVCGEDGKVATFKGLSTETTVRQIKQLLPPTVTQSQRTFVMKDGTVVSDQSSIGNEKCVTYYSISHSGQWRDALLKEYCNVYNENPNEKPCLHDEFFIEADHWSCCGSRLYGSPCGGDWFRNRVVEQPSNMPDEEDEDDNWKTQLNEFGLGKLFQRAPWVLQLSGTRKSVLRSLLNHPMRDAHKLNQALTSSFSPILIERRHQWGRSFRARKWRHNNVTDIEEEEAPPVHARPQPSIVKQEPPGEHELLIDSGLSLAHWFCLLSDAELVKITVNTLELPLSDSSRNMEPALTSCLKYTCLHYAAYASATDAIDTVCEWKTSTDIQGSDLLNYQVPCACHPCDGWHHDRLRVYDKNHRMRDLVKGAKEELSAQYCTWCLIKLGASKGDPNEQEVSACERCTNLSRAIHNVKQMNFERPTSLTAVQPLLENWKNNVAEVVNLGNCEGGGGLVHKRAMNPPTAGDTPLMVACQFSHVAACRRMVRTHKANAGLRNHEGYDAHDIAVVLQHRHEMQPQRAHAEGDDDDYGAAQRAAEHEENSSLLLERNIEMLNTTKPVKKKLFNFALSFFVKSLFHIFSFALVMTVLSWLTVQDGKKFFTTSSLSTVINTEEWTTAELNSQRFRAFREDLSATLELEDFSAWFSEPFQSKVLGERPYGMFQLVGTVRVSKQDVIYQNCTNQSATKQDTYKTYLDLQCPGVYHQNDLANPLVWGNWDVPRPVFLSRYSWTSYDLGVGDYVELHPDDKTAIARIAFVDELGSEGAFLNNSTRFVSTQFTFYNAYIDVFVVCQIFFEIFAQGAIQQTSRYRSVRINTYQTNADVFRLVLEIVFLIFLMMQTLTQSINLFVMAKRIFKEWTRDQHTHESFGTKLKNAAGIVRESIRDWYLLDLMLIILQYIVMVQNVRVLRLQRSLASQGDLLDVHNKNFYDEFIPLAWIVLDQEGTLGLIVLLSWIKCLKSLARLPSYGPIVNALISTMTDKNLFIFLFVFMWVILSFYLAMLTAFGTSLTAFRLPAPAALTMFTMVLGDTEHLGELEEHSWMGPVFFVLVIVFCQLVLLNLIVAVLQEIYVGAIQNAHAAWSSDIVSIYKHTLTSVVQPTHVVMHFLRKKGVLDFKEKHLKRPLTHNREEEEPQWVVVPHMDNPDRFEEHEGDELFQLKSMVEELVEQLRDAK